MGAPRNKAQRIEKANHIRCCARTDYCHDHCTGGHLVVNFVVPEWMGAGLVTCEASWPSIHDHAERVDIDDSLGPSDRDGRVDESAPFGDSGPDLGSGIDRGLQTRCSSHHQITPSQVTSRHGMSPPTSFMSTLSLPALSVFGRTENPAPGGCLTSPPQLSRLPLF